MKVLDEKLVQPLVDCYVVSSLSVEFFFSIGGLFSVCFLFTQVEMGNRKKHFFAGANNCFCGKKKTAVGEQMLPPHETTMYLRVMGLGLGRAGPNSKTKERPYGLVFHLSKVGIG